MTHARPHLQTHARGKGHSAVAGVAYRLGLRLFDKRTGEWHDYRKRALGEEIVAAFTLAPAGAPDWATDPAVVWGAVEAAEHRKDSQVAHDFRIPIPFGLTDTQAEAMARAMAQHIVSDWHTVVSVGLHRDSPVDALGQQKPFGKQGFHAHIYFPTRALSFDSEAVREAGEDGEGGSDGWHFGEKLHAFSKKKAAAMVITELNAQWAALANMHVAAIGGMPDFTHLSYKRLGLDRLPQLRLGPGAAAMERKGIATRKGDSLRAANGDAAPATTSTQPPTEKPAFVAPIVGASSGPRLHDWLNPAAPIVVSRSLPSQTAVVPTGLGSRFLAELDEKPELPQPTPEQRGRLLEWLGRIEHALRSLVRLVARLSDLRERRQRDDGARSTFAVELDDRRRRRAEARAAAAQWLAEHPWQLRMARAVGGGGKPTVLVELEGDAWSLNTEVQQLKRGVADAAERVAQWDSEMSNVQAEHDAAHEQLHSAVRSVATLDPLYGMLLLSVADAESTPMLARAMPTGDAATVDAPDAAFPTLELALRPESSRRVRPVL